MTLIPFSSIVEPNGKTIRENNMEVAHNIPIGTLCEVKYDEWFGGGAGQKVHARMWVVSHNRDCDGTPLYALSPKRLEEHLSLNTQIFNGAVNRIKAGFSEESLTPIEVTPELVYGIGALQWEDQ